MATDDKINYCQLNAELNVSVVSRFSVAITH